MESKWLQDVLVGGMTSNAFKLGTALSQGWFWMRPSGCATIYRGASVDTVDFEIVLAVSDADADSISPQSVAHSASSVYYYVFRRVNCCGDEEMSLNAAVRVAFDGDGDLIAAGCNGIFDIKAKQIAGPRVVILWYYCPASQGQPCSGFEVYGDNASGTIDYNNAIEMIDYIGPRFYVFESSLLSAGQYQFCIKAVPGGETVVAIDVDDSVPQSVGVLKGQAV
jgi:hypothetical protein